jgi:hypothetical protein
MAYMGALGAISMIFLHNVIGGTIGRAGVQVDSEPDGIIFYLKAPANAVTDLCMDK